MSVRTDSGGHTLAEALVALLVAGILVLCLAGILAGVGRVARRQAEAAAAAETERTVAAILGAEVRMLTAADASFGADSIRLRAFRGRGVVCSAGAARVDVAWSGARLPEEDKDSVLLVWADAEAAYALAGTGSGDCGDGSIRLNVDWNAAHGTGAPLFALVFETGAYSIANAAFRYRRGSAGRQPLTEENLSSSSGIRRIEREGAAAALVTLRAIDARRAPAFAWPLGMLQGVAP